MIWFAYIRPQLKQVKKENIFLMKMQSKKEMMHHVVFIVDRASKIVSIMVFGILSDGSVDTRSYGWDRIHPLLKDINNTYKCSYNPYFKGKIYHMRVYNRYLRTSEAIANFNTGLKEK